MRSYAFGHLSNFIHRENIYIFLFHHHLISLPFLSALTIISLILSYFSATNIFYIFLIFFFGIFSKQLFGHFLSQTSRILALCRFILGHSDQFSYQPSLLNAPDLPSWIHYTYSKKDHHGFLYGVAPKDQKYFQVIHNQLCHRFAID